MQKSEKVNQCGETCERAQLCAACGKEAAPATASQVWDEGYQAGINDERTSEANIGIAGFGAKVQPSRGNPYQDAPAPVAQPLTDAQIVAAARALNKLSADACGVDEADSWKLYGSSYIADAAVILKAAQGIEATGQEGGAA